MKTKFCAAFAIVILIYVSATAQQEKIKFQSKNSFGISIGQRGSSLLFQTVNGISFKKWFSGIGIGADYYDYKSYPLFIDVRRYFGKNDKAFGYADVGYNFSGKDKPDKEIAYSNSYDFSGGIYADFGIGYKMKFIRRSFLTISSGFTYKKINIKEAIITLSCPAAPGLCNVDYSNYTYGNGRVVLKAGVDF